MKARKKCLPGNGRQSLHFTSIVDGEGVRRLSYSSFSLAMNRPATSLTELYHLPSSRTSTSQYPWMPNTRLCSFTHPNQSLSLAPRPRFAVPSSSWATTRLGRRSFDPRRIAPAQRRRLVRTVVSMLSKPVYGGAWW